MYGQGDRLVSYATTKFLVGQVKVEEDHGGGIISQVLESDIEHQ
jgi:hypothetical protein